MTRAASAGATAAGAAVLLLYLVLVGGTTWGEIHLAPRLLNAAIGAALLIVYVIRVREADRLDGLVLLAVGLFAVTAAVSDYPRQSLDALIVALTYAAGLFVARRILADAAARRAVLLAMMTLSFVIVLLTASRWSVVVQWWALTGWSITPPLNMELDATPWGHRHDLALLAAMLYPAWWVGNRSRLRTTLAAAIGALTVYIVIVDGSRTLWLALAVATASLGTGAVVRAARRRPGLASAVAGGAAVIVVGLALIGGPTRSLLERAFTTDTIVARTEMWQPLLAQWAADPIAGLGPASFPFALQHTSYFTEHAWAPRHPDNVLVQALVEGGVLGVVAVGVVLFAIVPALLRSRERSARWALVAFAVAGIGASPTDFAFLVAVAIAWTAYALPVPPRADADARAPNPVTVASMVALALVFIGSASSLAGTTIYEAARSSAARGEVETARAQVSTARMLDPSLGLYARVEGVLALVDEDPEAAVDPLRRAVELAPADDQAWRALAIAHDELGADGPAAEALDRALAAQRSDPVNLLLATELATDEDARRALLAEVVQTWPLVLLTPEWQPFAGIDAAEAISAAVDRWLEHPESPEREIAQPLVLVAWSGRSDLVAQAISAGTLDRALALAYVAVAACEPDAERLLDEIPNAARRSAVYWSLRAREAPEGSAEQSRYRRMHEAMTGRPVAHRFGTGTLSPFDTLDLAAFSLDEWGYRRPPFPSLAWRTELPSPNAGRALWVIGEPPPPEVVTATCGR